VSPVLGVRSTPDDGNCKSAPSQRRRFFPGEVRSRPRMRDGEQSLRFGSHDDARSGGQPGVDYCLSSVQETRSLLLWLDFTGAGEDQG